MTAKKRRSRSRETKTSLAVRALARQNVTEAMERLVVLMRSDNPCVAMAAAKLVMDRGLGKMPVPHASGSEPVAPAPSELKVNITHLRPEEPADAR